MHNIGIAGFGFVGQLHHEAFSRLPDVKVVAVGDRSRGPEGMRRYADPFDLIEDPEVEAVVIALPTTMHVPLALAALEAGKPVLVEKPVALRTVDAAQLLSVSGERAVPLQVAQVLRHSLQPMDLANRLRNPDFGEPVDLRFSRECTAPNWAAWSQDPTLSGGALFDLMIHDLDFVHSVYGMPTRVAARAAETRSGALDHIAVTLTFGPSPSFEVSVTGSWRMPQSYPFTTRSRCLGTGQVIETLSRSGSAQINERGDIRTTVYGSDVQIVEFPDDPLDPFLRQARSFVDLLDDPTRSPTPGIAEAYEVLRIAEGAVISLDAGTGIDLT